jgi:hypothetical protein
VVPLTNDQAKALAVLARTHEGKTFLGIMGVRFDEAMKRLLYCEAVQLPNAQGAARELHETLKLFDDAVTQIEK